MEEIMSITIIMFYCAIFLFASFFFLRHSESNEVIIEKTRIFDLCRKQEGNLTKSDVKDYFDMLSVTELSHHPCFVRCVAKEYGVIKPDNVLDMDKIASVALTVWPRPKELPALAGITDYCVKKTKKNPNACVYMFEQSDCCFKRLTEQRDAGQFD